MSATDSCWQFFRPPPDDVAGGVLRAARAAAAIPAERELQTHWAAFGWLSTSPRVFGLADEPSLFGRITAQGALVHPLLGGVIAACLGLSEADLWNLVYFEAYWDGARMVSMRDVVAEDDDLDRSGPDFVRTWLEQVATSPAFPAALRAEGFGPRS